jgi:hypothetical protein
MFDKSLLRFLSVNTQELLLKNWDLLTPEAQKLVLRELENISQYEESALNHAYENNPNFWVIFQEKLKQIKSSYVHQIEKEEQEEELNTLS